MDRLGKMHFGITLRHLKLSAIWHADTKVSFEMRVRRRKQNAMFNIINLATTMPQ